MMSHSKAMLTALIIVTIYSTPSFAAIAGMPCEKYEIGKTQIDDNQKNIIGCLKVDDSKQIWKNFGGEDKIYSLTCSDWQSSGFTSEDSCIMDGRWHLVYSHNASGRATLGDLDSLESYIRAGADVKSGDEEGIHYCQEVVIASAVITCLDSSRIAGRVLDSVSSYQENDGKIAIGAAARRVDGARINASISPYNGGKTLQIETLLRDRHAMDWYVKF